MNGAESLVRNAGRKRNRGLFRQSRHLGNAFRRGAGQGRRIRAVLALFEGVVTGAADGYGRMAGKPAATLLHLGPGFANGIANLHNARRAATPIVNIVGDHASWHSRYDAP